MTGINGIPALYDYKNKYNAAFSPSTIHAGNSGLSLYFQRYLLHKLFSVYEFKIPENWDLDYFRYVLFCLGFGVVLHTDKFGVIFQHGQLYGYNIYYRPNRAIVTNPLLLSKDLKIGDDCEIIKLTPDYRGIYDVIGYYADMMAVIAETFGVNAINSKMSYVFTATNKAEAETLKKLYDKIASGEPAVVTDKKMLNDDGRPNWLLFQQDVKNNFIGLDLLECLQTIENSFCEMIGIKNANVTKRERLIIDEVNANNDDTNALVDLYIDCLNDSFKKVNGKYNLDLEVKKRNNEENGGGNYGEFDVNGNV